MNQRVFKRTYPRLFRSTTWCYHRTYVATCIHCRRSIVARLQAIERRLQTLAFALQLAQVEFQPPVVQVAPERRVEQLVLERIGLVQLEPVGTSWIVEAHIATHRFAV